MEIIKLAVVLYLKNHQFTLLILCKDIHTVKLIALRFLVALTFKQRFDVNLLAKQNGKQPLNNTVICLVAKNTLYSPVKTYETCHDNSFLFIFDACKLRLARRRKCVSAPKGWRTVFDSSSAKIQTFSHYSKKANDFSIKDLDYTIFIPSRYTFIILSLLISGINIIRWTIISLFSIALRIFDSIGRRITASVMSGAVSLLQREK